MALCGFINKIVKGWALRGFGLLVRVLKALFQALFGFCGLVVSPFSRAVWALGVGF